MIIVDSQHKPTSGARELLQWIRYKLSPVQLDQMVGQVALEAEANLKKATPKRWFGQVRNGWQTKKEGLGVRVVGNGIRAKNGVQIVAFLEEGTANNGTGFIFPKNSRRLFVPLSKRAAGGWRPGLKYGVDYVLKEKVRGIRGSHFVETERKNAQQRMFDRAKALINEILRN